MRFDEFIISKLPDYGLSVEDISLRDDGDGVFIDQWNSELPKPSKEQVGAWLEEFQTLSAHSEPTPEEKIAQLEQENEELRQEVAQTNALLLDLMESMMI
jgi:hypothetical protein